MPTLAKMGHSWFLRGNRDRELRILQSVKTYQISFLFNLTHGIY